MKFLRILTFFCKKNIAVIRRLSYSISLCIFIATILIAMFVSLGTAHAAQAEKKIVGTNNIVSRMIHAPINLTATILDGMRSFVRTVSGGKIGGRAQVIDGRKIREKNHGTPVSASAGIATAGVNINAITGFQKDVEFGMGFISRVGATINGLLRGQEIDLGGGKITAGNILYGLTPGDDIEVGGSPQRPIISLKSNLWKKENTTIMTRDPALSLAIGNDVMIGANLTVGNTLTAGANLTVGNTLTAGGDVTIGATTTGSFFHLLGTSAVIYDAFATTTIARNIINAWSIAESATSTPIISIDSRNNGSVGIGTGAPAAHLTIKNSQLGSIAFQINAANNQQANLFEINDATSKSLLIVDAAGRLGIGTNSLNAALSVASTSYFNGTLTASSSVYLATSGGRVGIGTLTPQQTLSIKGTFDITGDAQFGTAPLLTTVTNCGGSSVLETDGSGRITCGQDDVGSGGSPPAKNKGEVNSGSAGAFAFYASAGDIVSATPGMFYNTGLGLIGIGTTTPFAALSIATSGRPHIFLTDTSASVDLKHWYASSTQGSLTFGTIADSLATTSIAEKVRITNAGLFGIGTTTPGSVLSIQGAANFVNDTLSTSTIYTGLLTRGLTATSTGVTITGGGLTNTVTGTSTNLQAIQATLLNITSTSATSTFANGITLSGGTIRLASDLCAGFTNGGTLNTDANGNFICEDDDSGGGGTINTGTTNRLSYYSAGTTLDSADFLTIFTPSSLPPRLGLGTTTPYAALSLLSTSSPQFIITDYVTDPTKLTHWFASTTIGNLNIGVINNLNAGTTTYLTIASTTGRIGLSSTTPGSLLSIQGGNAQITGTTTSSGLIATSTLWVGATGNLFQVTQAGSVGIGTTSPGGVLSINNEGASAAFLISNVGSGNTVWFEDVANDTSPFVIGTEGSVGIGTTSPGSLLSVQAGNAQITGTTTSSALLATSTLWVGATGNLFNVMQSGFVGIGTTSPGSLLSVQGIANLTSGVLATSTFYTGIQAPGFSATSSGITITGGNILSTVTGTSTVLSGNISAAGLSLATNGLTITGGGMINTVAGTSTNLQAIQATLLNITSTSATSTFANGITLSGGTIRLASDLCAGFTNGGTLNTDANGNFICEDDDSGGGGTINSGTTNRLSYYSAGTTLDSADFLTIFTPSANPPRLGLGTTTPYAALSLLSTSSPQFIITDYVTDPTKLTHWFASTTIGNLNIGVINNLNAGTTTYLTIASTTGRIGLSSTTPGSLLSIQGGNAQITGTTTSSGLIATSTLWVGATGNLFQVTQAGNVGIATTSPSSPLSISAILDNTTTALLVSNLGSGYTAWFEDAANDTTPFVIGAEGSVGIGTTSPGSLLSVQGGNAQITGTTTSSALLATSTLWVGASGNLFQVTQAGRVGIGTTSPSSPLSMLNEGANTAFLVSNTGSGNTVWFEDAANDTTPFVIGTEGSVGIGTTSPGSLLSVQGGNAQITGTTTSSALIATSTLWVGATGNLFQVMQTGRVGIGTTSPGGVLSTYTEGANTAFLISNVGSGNTVWFEDVANDTSPFVISTTGNVGIGTTSPGGKLAVVGGVILTLDGEVTVNGVCHSGADIDTSGNGASNRLVACSGAPNDYAEWYPTNADVATGDIVAPSQSMLGYIAQGADPVQGTMINLGEQKISVLKKAVMGDTVLGIVSTAPFQTIGSDVRPYASSTRPIALSGRTYLNVNLEGGGIKPGDYLTLSSVAGVGAKATSSAMTIGIALESFDGHIFGGFASQDKILVFVNLGYAHIDNEIIESASSTQIADINRVWAIDQTTGKVWARFANGIDLSGNDLLNVAKIVSANGSWVIDENGKLTVKEIETEKLNIKENVNVGSPEKRIGITIYDEDTGNPHCIKVKGGAIVSIVGICGAAPPLLPFMEPQAIERTDSLPLTSSNISSETSPSPTPEPSPSVFPPLLISPAPEEEANPTPEPSPSISVSPGPSPSPEVNASFSPSEDPGVLPRPMPSDTPAPSLSPQPSASPTPEFAVSETPTPSPTP